MVNQQKRTYVLDLSEKILRNPQLILVGFGATKHKKLEELRGKIREESQVVVLKNSLFKLAFGGYNRQVHVLSQEEGQQLIEAVKGQTILILTSGDSMRIVKAVKEFAKEDESIVFKAGIIDGVYYEEAGLKKLADLPSKNELIAKILGVLIAPQSRLVYGLRYNTTKFVHVLKQAGAHAPASST